MTFQTMQALLSSILKQEKSRVIYLNCGIESVFTPELMAQQLRTQARMLFPQMGIKAIKTIAKTLKPASYLLKLLSENTSLTPEILTECISAFFPEDTSKDLTAVIKTFTLILESMVSWKKKPVIIIGNFLEK